MSYNEIAAQIVKDSIKTAYSVDDKIVEPYSDGGDPATWQKLYDSFRTNGCSLELAKFSDLERWDKKQKRFLKSKDLLVLDWELKENGSIPFEDTIKILSQAVSTYYVPFVCIYTQTEELETIVFNIISSLWEYSIPSDWDQNLIEIFNENVDIDFVGIEDEDWREILSKSKDSFIFPKRKRKIRGEIKRRILELTDGNTDFLKNIEHYGSELFGPESLDEILAVIELMGENYFRRDHDEDSYPIIPIECDQPYSLLINSTIVTLVKKDNQEGGVAPEELYGNLAGALSNRPNNFLSLLGLEYRNLMKERSIDFGSSLNSINEVAFFYHQECMKKNPDSQSAFDFFLKDLWETQVGGYWQNHKSGILSEAGEYREQKNINTEIFKLQKEPTLELREDLISLNIHTSILKYEPLENEMVRFGDIFSVVGKNRFLLCITPHCDCLRPDKSGNGFLFVEGGPITSKTALDGTDGRYVSFFSIDNDFFCINWDEDPRPYTIYMEPEIINLKESMVVNHKQSEILIKYLCTQKENYTQRIANNSLRFANRVGLSFASIM